MKRVFLNKIGAAYLLLLLGEHHVRRQTGLETSVVAAPLAELSAVDGDAAVAVEGTHEALLVRVLALRGAPEERAAAEASDAAVAADVFLKWISAFFEFG